MTLQTYMMCGAAWVAICLVFIPPRGAKLIWVGVATVLALFLWPAFVAATVLLFIRDLKRWYWP